MARILVVNDDKEMTGYLETALAAFGHTVTTANDSIQAFLTAVEETFDLIFVDLAMAKFTGEDFLRALRTRGRSTPVHVFTGGVDAAQVRRMQEYGCGRVIMKSARQTGLSQVINLVDGA